MNKLNNNKNGKVRPVIYCFTTPNDISHNGWCKIGYTEKTTADNCIYKESRRTDTECVKQWEYSAMFENGSYQPFKDYDFHKYLMLCGVERKESVYDGKRAPEFFKISPEKARELLFKFKSMEFIDNGKPQEYTLREEQKDAVDQTKEYFEKAAKKEILWNAKPRFGKTLSVYDFCKQTNAKHILVLTNRPAIANSWYDDYVKFIGCGEESGYYFISNCDALKNKKYCYTREEFTKFTKMSSLTDKFNGIITFVSLQDLKGSIWFGNPNGIDKLKWIANIDGKGTKWDVLVIDESHEGVNTLKTEKALNQIDRDKTIFLSGTPFKQIANSKFDKVFNWTYADEQEKKELWESIYGSCESNPYEDMPQLNLFTYRLSDIFKTEEDDKFNESNERDKYFDLNDFFETNENGNFKNDKDIDDFLNIITTNEKFPYGNGDFCSQINHSIWLLDRVDSVKALARKLKSHEFFKDKYKIVIAAGDGKLDDAEKVDDSFNEVKKAIATNERTITLSVGQLTTGVTIPEWSAVFMLCNVESESLYIQATFRAQNPCLIDAGNGEFVRKENAFIFDFDPIRTLRIFDKFANDLYKDTSAGKGTDAERLKNIEKLLRYFPVIGEDDNGNLISYDAQNIVTVPSKISGKEIIKHGFMSNLLFKNIGRIFNDKHALDILNGMREFKGKTTVVKDDNTKFDKNGNTEIDEDETNEIIDEITSGVEEAIPIEQVIDDTQSLINESNSANNFLKEMEERSKLAKKEKEQKEKEEAKERNERYEKFNTSLATKFETAVQEGLDEKYKDVKINTTKEVNQKKDNLIKDLELIESKHDIEIRHIKDTCEEELKECKTKEEREKIISIHQSKKEEKENDFMKQISELYTKNVEEIKDIVISAENKIQEDKNKPALDNASTKLRSFARSIPSFLMAYGDDDTTCDKFDKIIPTEIFKEMTGIEMEDYMYFIENEYFDTIAFNGAIKEFFILKNRLSDYFAETSTEDIFDYIPPQETNQIFTPKKVVKIMVDKLEKENPGCFDDPDKTFFDMYMKSGLYITEIVKRLYQSKKMEELYPDKEERLKHIFKEQVYGLAPTAIIYNIAKNYILGFDETCNITEHNLRQLDASKYMDKNDLNKKLNEIFDIDLPVDEE